VVGGGIVVDVVVEELVVEVVDVELVDEVEEELVVDPGTVVVELVLDVVLVGPGPAPMAKGAPSDEAPLLVHRSRTALSPTVLDGSGAVLPTKLPPAPDVNGVELNTVLETLGPECTSSTPSVAPAPRGQLPTTNCRTVPGGPACGP